MKASHTSQVAFLFGAAMSVSLVTPSGAIETAEQPLSPDKAFFGLTYGDWGAAWWQYMVSIPAAENPLNDGTGADCVVGQSSGPVFFLAGSFVGTVTRVCEVPAGKVLFFPIINVECSTVEDPPFFGANEHERATARRGSPTSSTRTPCR